MMITVSTLGVRTGFRSTKLSTYHKTPIEKLNLNLTTAPRMTPKVCCIRLSFLSSEFDKVVFKFYVKIDFCF